MAKDIQSQPCPRIAWGIKFYRSQKLDKQNLLHIQSNPMIAGANHPLDSARDIPQFSMYAGMSFVLVANSNSCRPLSERICAEKTFASQTSYGRPRDCCAISRIFLALLFESSASAILSMQLHSCWLFPERICGSICLTTMKGYRLSVRTCVRE